MNKSTCHARKSYAPTVITSYFISWTHNDESDIPTSRGLFYKLPSWDDQVPQPYLKDGHLELKAFMLSFIVEYIAHNWLQATFFEESIHAFMHQWDKCNEGDVEK